MSKENLATATMLIDGETVDLRDKPTATLRKAPSMVSLSKVFRLEGFKRAASLDVGKGELSPFAQNRFNNQTFSFRESRKGRSSYKKDRTKIQRTFVSIEREWVPLRSVQKFGRGPYESRT